MKKEAPATIIDLLLTLEKSRDLRPLALECGLSVRELRRRLQLWRQEVQVELTGRQPAPAAVATAAADETFGEYPAAADIAGNPLPAEGEPVLEIFTDGASKGNPGPAAVGIVFSQKRGPVLCTHCEAIGEATNNVAEYRAVIRALEIATAWGVTQVHLNLDSELVVRQLTGQYRVKSEDLRPLYQQVVFLARRLAAFRVKHVRRELNAHADRLANLALKRA